MNRTFLFSGVAALLLGCTSPQTETTPTPAPEIALTDPGLLTSITEYRYAAPPSTAAKSVSFGTLTVPVLLNQINTFSYDAQKRLTQHLKTASDQSWTSINYQYSAGGVDVEEKSSWGRTTAGRWTLNDKGYITGDATAPAKPNEYVYDADGFMVRYEGNTLIDTRTVEKNNVSRSQTTYAQGGTQRNTYTYDLTKPGVPSPLTYRGRESRNLLIRQQLVSGETNPTATVFTYQYEFDKQGRAIRELLLRDGTQIERVREFTYQ